MQSREREATSGLHRSPSPAPLSNASTTSPSPSSSSCSPGLPPLFPTVAAFALASFSPCFTHFPPFRSCLFFGRFLPSNAGRSLSGYFYGQRTFCRDRPCAFSATGARSLTLSFLLAFFYSLSFFLTGVLREPSVESLVRLTLSLTSYE